MQEITKKAVEKEDMFGAIGPNYLIPEQQDVEYVDGSLNGNVN